MRQVVCLVALVALCLMPVQAQAADGIKTYTSSNGGYSLAYPNGWRVFDGDADHSVHITDKSGEAVDVKILAEYFDKTKTVDAMSQSELSDFTLALVQAMHAHQPEGMLDFAVDDFGVTRVGNQKAVYIATTAQWDNSGKTRQSKYVLYCLLHKGDLFVVITESVPAVADSFKPTFQKSLDSFKFL